MYGNAMGMQPIPQYNPYGLYGTNNRFNNYLPNNQVQAQTQTNGAIWVNGIEGGKAFQLPPNSNAVLLDSENEGIFYIKVSDSVGMCTLRVFKYVEITQNNTQATQTDMSEYVKRDEIEQIIKKIINGGVDNGEQPISTANSKSTAAK